VTLLVGAGMLSLASAPAFSMRADDSNFFRLRSTTFENGSVIPSTMVANVTVGSVCAGGNQSPELSWTNAPQETKSFVVTVFDKTAAVTHWAAYNIPPTTTNLDENAGSAPNAVAPFGDQTVNSVFFTFGYLGPCPPFGLVHHYEFTVFALDKGQLDLPSPPGFPPDPEALYRAMFNHILDQASIIGLFSCPADSNPSLPNPSTCF